MSRIKWFSTVRVFGLLLVLGYHLFYDWLPGGFLGVDIFFTVSGFLITALILDEVYQNNHFALFKFYKRRLQRILIPLFLAVTFTLPFALLISPDFTVGIAKQIASALSFTSNWYNIIIGSSYEAQLLPPMYIHTWSLAVIMQFYLVWGLICAVVSVLAKAFYHNNSYKRYVCFRTVILILSGTIGIDSFLYMEFLYNTNNDLNIIYFNTLTRFFPFFIGAFAAAVWGVKYKQNAALKPNFFFKHSKPMAIGLIFITLLAAAMILLDFSQYKFDDRFIYHYGFLFTSLLTVVLIYSTYGLNLLTPPQVKEPRILKAADDMSYYIYLFHWPFYVVFSALIMNNTHASLITIAMTIIFSVLAVYGVERVLIPAPGAGAIKLKYRRVAMTAVCVSIICAVSTGGIVIAKAPAITSIEADFAVSSMVQDASAIAALTHSIEAVNTSPVLYAGENAPLKANILPRPSKPPDLSLPPGQQTTDSDPGPRMLEISGGVSVIGDSVLLGAQAAIKNTIFNCYVDAAVARSLGSGVEILTNLQNRGELREYVVIGLGTNGTYSYEKLLMQMIDALNPGHKLIFITPYDGRANENGRILNDISAWMRALPDQYEYITIADWNSLISSRTNLLAADKVHLGGQPSKTLYADLIAEAIDLASQKPSK